MIKSFRCKETEKIWKGQRSKKLPSQIQEVARRKLKHLEYAININDLRVPPANRLEELKGDKKGKYSIRINQQWRIMFLWDNGAYDIEIIDYH
jgi:toxin HigB-1